jgi:hypothetical protein
VRRWILVALGAVVCGVCGAAPVDAQTVDVLTRSAFRLGAEHLSGDDERFVWDTNFGGEIDLVDYGGGRLTFAANYEAVLGERFRSFDPEQGNYLLTGLASRRFSAVEAAVVFHHESRHLSDRFKREAVDWNMLGGRVWRSLEVPGARIDARADLRAVVIHSFVDYSWEFDGNVRVLHPLSSRAGAFVDGDLRLLGVDGSQDRGTQAGYRVEGGLRLAGKGAATELYVAAERRIDPYPLEFGTAHWFTAGFRLVSR